MSQAEPLISPGQLSRRIAEGDESLVIVDCRFDLMAPERGVQDYQQGHLPMAHYAHLDRDLALYPLSGPAGGRHPLPRLSDFAQRLERWGMHAGTHVVAYDDACGAIAARLWWLLRYFGHGKVSLLDGGYPAWLEEGLPVTKQVTENASMKANALISKQPAMPVMDAEAIARGLASGRLLLIDARAAPRFAGQSEPIDRVAGHIPGAVNRPFTENLTDSGRFKDRTTLRAAFQKMLNQVPPDQAAHMCGSGVTACHNLIAMEHAGLQGSSLYLGSWSDWISEARESHPYPGPDWSSYA